ncbi:MAG: sensor histidine kinase [Betaproteobacteria bacterium]|nr:sensor histidine kinase [Betaproteobacteria bacterium]MDH5221701.1 sensor histidine kinase [Betaproteobacteria bacterium]MDH5350856.1 sensor histidine kinase [Betaproteobacteria bacterium]
MPLARALFAALLLAAPLPGSAAEAEQWRHRDAGYLFAREALTPPKHLPWQPVRLPDRWKENWPGITGTVWYRVTFRAPRPEGEPWMVYLPRLRDGGALFVNGQLLATVREPGSGTWVRWMRPHAFVVPPGDLREGENELHVRVDVASADKTMSTVWIGPEDELRPVYESRFFWAYTAAQITTAVTLAMAVFVLTVSWRRRMQLDYGLFGLACLFWGLHTLNYVIETVPESWWLGWRVMRYAATGGFAASITLFYLRFAGFRPRGITRLFAAYWISGPLALAIGGAAAHAFVDRYYQAGLLLMGVAMIAGAVHAAWRQRSMAAFALLCCALLGLAGSVHDYMLSQGIWFDPEEPFVLYFAAVALLVVVGVQLADRFVKSLGAVERMNVTLAEQVAHKERELAANYEQLRGLEHERTVASERQRIMQDMHDGLGSQLLTSLAAVERGALDSKGMAQVLRDAMDDMRLSIDTLSPGREGLLEALGNLRYRLEPRFRAAGIDLRFSYRDVPERLDIEAEDALQILRMLQESLTNVLKHARAKQVAVQIALEGNPARFMLSVADDGGGFDAAAPASGRGLSGMRRRAEKIGASLDIASDTRGTRITLSFPLGAQR